MEEQKKDGEKENEENTRAFFVEMLLNIYGLVLLHE
jgi:hypothetical protein